jgi:hypothetical protein
MKQEIENIDRNIALMAVIGKLLIVLVICILIIVELVK